MEDIRFNGKCSFLCDYLNIIEFQLSASDVKSLADTYGKEQLPESRFAAAAKDNMVYGLGRMWRGLSFENPMSIQVFRTVEEALDWLKK